MGPKRSRMYHRKTDAAVLRNPYVWSSQIDKMGSVTSNPR
jgi:hypothetical protein